MFVTRKPPKRSFAKRLIEDLFFFIYLLIYFTHSKSGLQVPSRKKRIKMLDYWMPCGEQCVSRVGVRLPSVCASCEPVLLTSAEQSENIIMEGMHPMVSLREAEPWFFPSPWSQSLRWLLFPNYWKTLQMWLKNDFVGCLTEQFLLRRQAW